MTNTDEIVARLMRVLTDEERLVLVTKIAGYAVAAFERLPKDVQSLIENAITKAEHDE